MFNEGVAETFLANSLCRRKAFVRHLAYVVMPDHCHLLLYPREAIYDMGKIAASIKKQ